MAQAPIVHRKQHATSQKSSLSLMISPRLPFAPPQPDSLVPETEEKQDGTQTKTHGTSGVTEETIVLVLDDVGIPNEGIWDMIVAYLKR